MRALLLGLLLSAPAQALTLQVIAPDTWLAQGEHAAWAEHAQAAHVANLSVAAGKDCVAVIDTGGSVAVGHALRQAIAQQTRLPVCWLINTHAHPDHVLGNPAFDGAGPQGRNPEVIAHARLPAALAARGPHYERAARRDLGTAHHGPLPKPPTRVVADVDRIDLGGRTLTLRAWPTAHTDHDLTVHDEDSGLLWTGDLLFVDHLPVLDGKLLGWLKVMESLSHLNARLLVPGHGALQRGNQALLRQQRYLVQLRDAVRTALRQNQALDQLLAQPPDVDLQGWQLTPAFHRRNLSAAFAELEWEPTGDKP
jgi:quinoprotein relay system zinc metallohydrolase 2